MIWIIGFACFLLSFIGGGKADDPPTDLQICWRDSYGRGVGVPQTYCGDGREHQGALCYDLCKANYTGVGPVCWENCPPGFTDIGALCTIPVYIYCPCPWYDVCGLTFAKGCNHCPDGFHNDGCSCRRPGQTKAKNSYGRGAGYIPTCPPTMQEDAGLCYNFCKEGFSGVGPVCWRQGSGSTDYPVQCSEVSYGKTEADCQALKEMLKKAGLTSAVCVAALAVSIVSGHIVGLPQCVDLIKSVLPALVNTHVCQ